MKYIIKYSTAIHWCHNNFIMFNEAPEIFPEMWENFNAWGGWWENGKTPEEIPEIFQYFLTDCSEHDVRLLTKHFPNLLFLYCEKIDKFFLCVDHYGTAWDYVWTDFEPDENKIMLSRKNEDWQILQG